MPTKRQARRKANARTTSARHRQGTQELQTEPQAVELRAPALAVEIKRPHVWRDRATAVFDHRRFPVVALLTIFAISSVGWAIVGSRHPYPDLFPDEMFYGKLSQNFASGDGVQWRGTTWGLPPLWPVLISFGWHLASVPEAWALIKIFCAGLASSVVFPVWLLARRLVGDRRALVAALLSVAGSWMFVTPFIITENFAYPVATASLAALIVALQKARGRWLAISLGFALLAILARTQMLALPVAIVTALVLDVVRQPAGARAERFNAWPRALWIGLGTAVVALLLVFILKPGLTNYDVLQHHASIGDILATAGHHAVTVITAVAFIPVLVFFALMLDRRNWRDDEVGPVLVVTVATSVVLLALIGRFEVWATFGHAVERYTMYLAPLFAYLLVLAPGRLTPRRTLAGGGLMVAALFGLPKVYNYIEQPSLFGTQQRFFRLGGFPADHLTLSVVALGLLMAGVAYFAFHRFDSGRGLVAVTGLMVVAMVTQSVSYQNELIRGERAARPLIGGKTLNWVDKTADGDVAMLAIGKGEPMHQNVDLYTDFFNRKIKSLYSTEPVNAGECELDIKPRGYFNKSAGYCPAFPRNLVLLEREVHLTLRGERILKKTELNGWLIKVPPGEPRIFGLVRPPCTVNGCSGQLQLGLYLDQPARVAVTFAASSKPHRVQTGGQIQTLPAGEPATIRFPVPKGDHGVNMPVDWQDRSGPALRDVLVQTEGKTIRIY